MSPHRHASRSGWDVVLVGNLFWVAWAADLVRRRVKRKPRA